MDRMPKVLFFSTGNATRSRMAQAFLRRMMGDKVSAASTAVTSADTNPLAVEVMKEVGVDISDQTPKGVKETLTEHFVCVVTLSDDSKERSPVWPFTRNVVHWNLPDPGAVDGPPEQRREMFRRVRDEIARRMEEFVRGLAPQLQARAAGRSR
jgi:arsenate reductase (thioredoxin)